MGSPPNSSSIVGAGAGTGVTDKGQTIRKSAWPPRSRSKLGYCWRVLKPDSNPNSNSAALDLDAKLCDNPSPAARLRQIEWSATEENASNPNPDPIKP